MTRELWSIKKVSSGYLSIKTPDGVMPHHRWVMEQALGRKLLPTEAVHHKNEIKDDNRLENLEVMTVRTHNNTNHKIARARRAEEQRKYRELVLPNLQPPWKRKS